MGVVGRRACRDAYHHVAHLALLPRIRACRYHLVAVAHLVAGGQGRYRAARAERSLVAHGVGCRYLAVHCRLHESRRGYLRGVGAARGGRGLGRAGECRRGQRRLRVESGLQAVHVGDGVVVTVVVHGDDAAGYGHVAAALHAAQRGAVGSLQRVVLQPLEPGGLIVVYHHAPAALGGVLVDGERAARHCNAVVVDDGLVTVAVACCHAAPAYFGVVALAVASRDCERFGQQGLDFLPEVRNPRTV